MNTEAQAPITGAEIVVRCLARDDGTFHGGVSISEASRIDKLLWSQLYRGLATELKPTRFR